MERYVGKHQKEPGHQPRDTASPVDNVRSPEVGVTNHMSVCYKNEPIRPVDYRNTREESRSAPFLIPLLAYQFGGNEKEHFLWGLWSNDSNLLRGPLGLVARDRRVAA